MKSDASPIEKFDGWFVKAIDKLDELPEGDGAFAALMIALPLYERYIVGRLKLNRRSAGDDEKREEIGKDLGLDDHQRRIFWSVFRNGFTHQGMALNGKTKWMVSHTFGALPEFKTINGHDYICLDPWKFARRLLDEYRQDPRLITASDSFPLADVFSISAG